jgi:hypothetical protein
MLEVFSIVSYWIYAPKGTLSTYVERTVNEYTTSNHVSGLARVRGVTLGKFFTHGELNLNTSREKRKGKRGEKRRERKEETTPSTVFFDILLYLAL